MEEIKKNVELMYLNCDFTNDDIDSASIEDTIDKIDCILNIIESTQAKSLVDCNLAIKRVKRIIDGGAYESSV